MDSSEKKGLIVINTVEREAMFTILIGIAMIVMIAIAILLIMSYSLTPQLEARRLTVISRNSIPCVYDTQCPDWQECRNNLCAPKKGNCIDESDCEVWQSCDTEDHTCYKKLGRCEADNECMSGEYCDINTHYCVFNPELIG
ncbi:MAG: hypothetical protein JXA43_02730 [Candidatus Diapherotrites archaeon]|nr:hypothetical protein [Candidatus Diapherotrites archaeon]